MLIFECLFGSMKMQKIESKISHNKNRKFSPLLPPKSLGVVLWILIFILNCTDQKDYCKSKAGKKGGSFYSDSESACLSYLSYQESIRNNEERNQPTTLYRFLADESLLACLYKTIEERKCENESEYIPHIGY